MTDEENENPPIRIPTDEKGVHEITEEDDEEEDGVTEQQRRNLAETQARRIGDIG